jgi:hypothetical protein
MGASGGAWFIRQLVLGVAAFLICAAPAVALLPFAAVDEAPVIGLAAIGTLAVNHVIGWTIVVPLDNPLGQVAGGVVSAGGGATLAAAITNAFPGASISTAIFVFALFVASIYWSYFAERRRWRYSGYQTTSQWKGRDLGNHA